MKALKLTHWAVLKIDAKNVSDKSIIKTRLTRPQAKKLMREIAKDNEVIFQDDYLVKTENFYYSIMKTSDSLDKLFKK